jgi:hypothetical protein
MSKKIKIVKNEVKNFNLGDLPNYNKDFNNPDWWNWEEPSGKSEYRLYAYLSHKVNNTTILDVGTRLGSSALALSSNPKNKVISYDLVHWESQEKIKKDNIEFKVMDFTKDTSIDYSKVDIIMIDVDPHDGLQEPIMINYLKSIGWEGILLLDDIDPNQSYPWVEMLEMWNKISEEKYDVTDIGHYSGTGLVNIGNKFEIEIV